MNTAVDTLLQTDQPQQYRLKRSIMIAWKNECYRSAATAKIFGADLHLIKVQRQPRGWRSILTYPNRAAKTIAVIARARPENIICLNQPPILPLICAAMARVIGAKVVMDFHSGALTKSRWKIFLPFLKNVARRSPFTICHNRSDGREIASWGAKVVHLLTLPQQNFEGYVRQVGAERPFFLFSCSFAEDEPVETAVLAMSKCPEYDFLISGNYKKHGIDPSRAPSNVKYAGFMDYRDYLQAMAKAHAVITLSDRQHIMQMAVHEAITLEVPVVTNHSESLEEVLGNGGIYCELTPASLVAGLRQAVEKKAQLSDGIVEAKSRAFQTIEAEISSARMDNDKMFEQR